MHRHRMFHLAVVALAALIMVPATAAATPAAGPPGSLVTVTRTEVFAAPSVPLPGRAWALTYRSTSATGVPDVVGGTLLLPAGRWPGPGERPLVSYAVGTHGLGDRCAPSVALAGGTEVELLLIGQALARGWAVVVTDYEGLGTPGPHTYNVSSTEGHAVLDAARAAMAVSGAELSPAAPVGIWGYSQGGAAAGAAAERAAGYAPELDVRGVAAGGVPADIGRLVRSERADPATIGLIVAVLTGFDAAYPELGLRERLTPPGQALYDAIADDCVGEISDQGRPFTADELTGGVDPFGSGAAAARVAQNRVGGAAPAVPALVYHGGADTLVEVGQGRGLRADWCARGATVRYRELPLTGHVGAALLGGPGAVRWLAARFAGVPAPSNC